MSEEGVRVEGALQWCADGFSDELVGFANSIRTVDGGTHLEGLKSALTRTVNAIGKCVVWKLAMEDVLVAACRAREGGVTICMPGALPLFVVNKIWAFCSSLALGPSPSRPALQIHTLIHTFSRFPPSPTAARKQEPTDGCLSHLNPLPASVLSHLGHTFLHTFLLATAKKQKLVKDGEVTLNGEHIREGLSAIVSVAVPDPEFEGQTKTRLGNPGVKKIVDTATAEVRG